MTKLKVNDVLLAGELLLQKNIENGTGHLLKNMAIKVIEKNQEFLETDLECVICAVATMKRSINQFIAFYA